MRTRSVVLPLLLLVAMFAAACGSDSQPAVSPTAATTSPSTAGGADDMATAIKNLQTPPDPLDEDEATCVANFVGEENLALVDNFTSEFRNSIDAAEDPASLEDGERIMGLIRGAAEACLNGGSDCSSDGGDACSYGDESALDALYDDCGSGDMAACDELYITSAVDSEYESFGASCGGIESGDTPGTCAAGGFGEGTVGEDFATQLALIDCDTVDGPCDFGESGTLDALWIACEDGDMLACDDLFFDSGIGTVYEAFGDTCGDRQPGGQFCDPTNRTDGESGESLEPPVDCTGVEDPCGYGDDATLDALWDECEIGNGASCDALFRDSPSGSRYEQFGNTCGDRGFEGSCEDVYGGGG